MKITKQTYFQRQLVLSEIGEQKQELLQKAKVLVIGCGGLGSPAAIYLANSGVGHIHLVDFDLVSPSNLHRQTYFRLKDLGNSKAEILANEIVKRAPFTKVTFSDFCVDKSNILKLISDVDVVVDGTDNLPIKYLINEACVLEKKPLVYGSLYKFDGYVATFNVLDGENYTCNLRDAFPTIAKDIPNCEEAGTMNPIVGIIALMQVNEVIKLITKTGSLLTNQILIYNALNNTQFKMKLKKNNDINIQEIFENTKYKDDSCSIQDQQYLISKEELVPKLEKDRVELISVINNKYAQLPFKVHQRIPYKLFEVDRFKPDYDKEYIFICQRGITSYEIVVNLKEKYPELKISSLVNGTYEF
jgi:adenylyltransferase/sulfurtransferase